MSSESSTWVYPPKYASSIVRRCACGSASRAARTVRPSTFFSAASGVLVTGLKLRHLERRGPERRLATKDVDGTVMDDREEPGPGIPALAAIARRAAPGGEEGVLYDVLGALTLPEDPVGQGVRQASVAVIERGERAQIPGGQGAQERVVGRLLVRHSENCTVGGQGWMNPDKEASRATCLRALPQLQSSAAWPWSRSSISSRTAFDAISGCAPGDRCP